MRPRRTPTSNKVFRLPGGTEDNDLWVHAHHDDGNVVIDSVWEPTEEEREQIAEGANIELRVWTAITPPVSLAITNEPLGRDGG